LHCAWAAHRCSTPIVVTSPLLQASVNYDPPSLAVDEGITTTAAASDAAPADFAREFLARSAGHHANREGVGGGHG
jgi:hypothetical protein